MEKKTTLRDREIEGLAYFFAIWWAVVVLNPRGQQQMRALMVSFGLVKPRGRLALTAAGHRVMEFCKSDGRPKYHAPKRKP